MDNTNNTYQPIVGKNLIEILMFSMYSDSLIILENMSKMLLMPLLKQKGREYCQI